MVKPQTEKIIQVTLNQGSLTIYSYCHIPYGREKKPKISALSHGPELGHLVTLSIKETWKIIYFLFSVMSGSKGLGQLQLQPLLSTRTISPFSLLPLDWGRKAVFALSLNIVVAAMPPF